MRCAVSVLHQQVSQSYGAFNHILGDLSLIVNQFESLSAFSAGIDRLGEFLERMNGMGELRWWFQYVVCVSRTALRFVMSRMAFLRFVFGFMCVLMLQVFLFAGTLVGRSLIGYYLSSFCFLCYWALFLALPSPRLGVEKAVMLRLGRQSHCTPKDKHRKGRICPYFETDSVKPTKEGVLALLRFLLLYKFALKAHPRVMS